MEATLSDVLSETEKEKWGGERDKKGEYSKVIRKEGLEEIRRLFGSR